MGHATELGLRNVAELSVEARAFARQALTQQGFHLFFRDGDDLIMIGMRQVGSEHLLLKGVYSLTENRVRTLFKLGFDDLASHVRGKIHNRGWIPFFVD